MRRLILPLLAVLGACHAPAVKITPYHPPSWLMPETFAVAQQLDTLCPLDHPVKINVKPLQGLWGESWFDETEQVYIIEINPAAEGPDGYADTLSHEWAHCMTKCECEDPHCEHWGAHYAQCYRAIH